MQLLTDIMRPMLTSGEISQADFDRIMAEANVRAHSTLPSALDYLEAELQRGGVMEPEAYREQVRLAIAGSDTIRYAQLGSPETILIGSIEHLPPELFDRFAWMGSALAPVWRTPSGTTFRS